MGYATRHIFNFTGFSVALALIGLVCKDLLNYYLTLVPNLGLVLLVCGVFLCVLIGMLSGRLLSLALSIPNYLSIAFLCAFLASIINSYAETGRINLSPLFLSFYLAQILFAANKHAVMWILCVIPIVNLMLQTWEIFSGDLLFPTVVEFYGFTVDTDGWKIGDEEIRTKGLFQGPIHIVSVCILALIAIPYSLLLRLVFLCVAYMGAARLGILIALFFLMLYFASSFHSKHLMRFSFLLKTIIVSSCMVVIIFVLIQLGFFSLERVKFILLAFDFSSNDSNVTRLDVWLSSLEMYFNFNIFGMLFGRYDEIRYLSLHGSTESDWLRLLLDNGLFGMLIYLIAFGHMVRDALVERNEARLVCLMGLFVVMHLSPAMGWLAGATGFWIIYLFLNSDYRYRSQKIGLSMRRDSSTSASLILHPSKIR